MALHQREILLQRRDALRGALPLEAIGEVERLQLLQSEVFDQTRVACDPRKALVVKDDGDAVLGELNVKLRAVRAERKRARKREHRVFRIAGREPAVCDGFDQWVRLLSKQRVERRLASFAYFFVFFVRGLSFAADSFAGAGSGAC